ncbi:amino acid transmembrane transporter [Pseudohyphozyma bogoriensis]|nr:amino acid transmembrane transporter [Pseudohyphozyma bogoriensis]
MSFTDKTGFASDPEKQDNVDVQTGVHDMAAVGLQGQPLERQLKSRHIQMISIGGVIGTGLFLGTANALRHGGPLGLLLGYMTMGSITYSIMVALGEMIAHLPLPGGHITLAQRFVDPAFSFMMGWNYWYNWTIVLPAELNAAAVLIGYWNDTVNPAAWITICLVVAVAINFGGTRAYGEMEFWFAIIKVLTISGLIILGIVLSAGGGPDHKTIGFRFWHNPGPFVQYLGIEGSKGRFLGYWAVLTQAAFSYIGTEIVAIAAGEAKNPKKNLPKAIKRVYIRILLFYILGTFIIGLLVSSSDKRLALGTGTAVSSPFVIAINNSGIKVLPSLINACLLTSAWSAASSDLYTSSRALYGLAANGNAPKIFTRVNSWGLPYVAVITGSLFALLSFMSAGAAKAGEVFNWFANMTSVCGLITWAGIVYTYIRFHKGLKLQGIDRNSLPYKAPLQPYLSYYALVFCCIILFFNGWTVFFQYDGKNFDHATFWTSYIPIILLPFTYFGYKFSKRVRTPNYDSMDFFSGSRDTEEEEESAPKGFIQKAWAAIM